MTPLGREIAATIERDGPVRLDRYMALCLSHPAYGYYATRDPFGRGGDFVTAPEISQMFGELIGLWAAETWASMGAPKRFSLIELGPGRGTLMADMIRAAKAAPGFLDAAEITLVETSPALREVQAKALAERDVRWATTIQEALTKPRHPGRNEAESRDRPQDDLPLPPSPSRGGVETVTPLSENAAPLPVIVVANEFFDALPIRQFVRTETGWRERLVGLDDAGRLAFGLSPAQPDIRLPDAPEGSIREICPLGLDVMTVLARHIAAHGGAALAIDYGYATGLGDTLQAMKAHAYADPFATPGEADLTAHVDFGALAAAARAAGAAPMKLIDQADLLERLGLGLRAEALSRAAPTGREKIFAAARRLTDRDPRGMGALFKALAVCDPRMIAPPAFEPIPARSA